MHLIFYGRRFDFGRERSRKKGGRAGAPEREGISKTALEERTD